MKDRTPPEEIRSRIIQLQRKMAEKGLDLVLILQNVDLFYFSGTLQKGYLFVPFEGEALLFIQKDFGRSVNETPLRCMKIDSMGELPNLLKGHPLAGKRVGMELDVVPVSLFNRIKVFFRDWEITDVSSEIKEIRSIKSDFEIEQLKRSGQIIDHVFSQTERYIREGMTELELDGILTSIGRAHGHQGFLRMRGLNQEMMNIHVLSGESGATHSFCDTPLSGYGVTPAIAQGSSSRAISRDQPIVIDYGGGYNGYVTDETRTFVIGRLKNGFEKAYQVALEIIEEMESFVKPGEAPVRIYERAQGKARQTGFAENFMGHGEGKVAFVGHGLGLEINEWPLIGRGYRHPLQVGNVFAFEPKFVFPREGAVGIELDYVVRENGVERITTFPQELVVI
ncbi:MAG TPA: Xaa-Pro peptidase family protein [Thermodesulfobacteriota bacterium]|nr:Xaa-Pro peptidase family protein [Thermodesulfobacteriota bacterium]